MPRSGSHPDDPRALVAEAYRIEDLLEGDARAIFFDWALGLPAGTDHASAARRLLAHHADQPAAHPMTNLLRAAAEGRAQPRRRGGARAARRRTDGQG